MKSAVVFSGLAGLALAANPIIAGLGSSYAAGPNLTKPIGQILAEKLQAKNGITYDFRNIAVSGTLLINVTNNQAPQLAGTKPAAVYLTSGGNDLNYVKCLYNTADPSCNQPISRDEFKTRYGAALDAIVKAINNDTTVPIYAVTYIQAVDDDSNCGAAGNDQCTFNAQQLAEIKGIYTNIVNGTVDALSAWKNTNGNSKYRVTLIPMRQYSNTHHVGSSAPWINGKVVPGNAKGATWHPNDAGAQAVAQYLYNDLTK